MKIKKGIGDFKAFIMKGNVLDLAVGVIIGAAFGKIVTSLVNDIIMPVIGLVLGKINLTNLAITLVPEDKSTEAIEQVLLKYGSFLQNIIDFLIIALCIFLFIKLIERFRRKKEEAAPVAPSPTHTEELLTEIRDLLKERK